MRLSDSGAAGSIPRPMRLAMLAFAKTVMDTRKPDVVIGSDANPYVHRWWLGPRGDKASCYLHRFLRSDEDRALHDHRYDNVSTILEGECREHFYKQPLILQGESFETDWVSRFEGEVVQRKADMPHRIELVDGKPMTTIFFTGDAYREWGFSMSDGWLHWKLFHARFPEVDGGNYAKTAT